jgi:Fur family peroxide stress response transcriptional regulator
MEKFRHLGIKLTPQRLAVLQYLEGNKDHPSAEDIYRVLHKRFPTMSLATVYNALSTLKEKGGVLELTLDPARKRYDPDTRHHDHLICKSCRRIVDIPDAMRIALPESARQDFAVVESHVEFYGICPKCKKKKDKPTKEAVHVRRS